jgi:hypothetical protein
MHFLDYENRNIQTACVYGTNCLRAAYQSPLERLGQDRSTGSAANVDISYLEGAHALCR